MLGQHWRVVTCDGGVCELPESQLGKEKNTALRMHLLVAMKHPLMMSAR